MEMVLFRVFSFLIFHTKKTNNSILCEYLVILDVSMKQLNFIQLYAFYIDILLAAYSTTKAFLLKIRVTQ